MQLLHIKWNGTFQNALDHIQVAAYTDVQAGISSEFSLEFCFQFHEVGCFILDDCMYTYPYLTHVLFLFKKKRNWKITDGEQFETKNSRRWLIKQPVSLEIKCSHKIACLNKNALHVCPQECLHSKTNQLLHIHVCSYSLFLQPPSLCVSTLLVREKVTQRRRWGDSEVINYTGNLGLTIWPACAISCHGVLGSTTPYMTLPHNVF